MINNRSRRLWLLILISHLFQQGHFSTWQEQCIAAFLLKIFKALSTWLCFAVRSSWPKRLNLSNAGGLGCPVWFHILFNLVLGRFFHTWGIYFNLSTHSYPIYISSKWTWCYIATYTICDLNWQFQRCLLPYL